VSIEGRYVITIERMRANDEWTVFNEDGVEMISFPHREDAEEWVDGREEYFHIRKT
jgi:hypothetical protein